MSEYSGYKPAIYAKFIENHILSEGGRLVFSLLNAFATSGHKIVISDTINFDTSKRSDALTLSLNDLTVTSSIPDNSKEYIYIFDKEDKACSGREWKKKIQIKFDIFSSYWLRRKPVVMPYPLHPVHWGHHGADMPGTLERLRHSDKRIRLFFSGDTKGYNRPKITYPDVKLSRPEIIDTLVQHLPDDSLAIDNEAMLDSVFKGEYANKFVVLDTSKLWIDDSIWFDRLSSADFFLAPPGICMPMCHNVIEAMALGVIPVINYPEWFTPRLEHMKNCVVFGSGDDLIKKVRQVLKMGSEQISELRKNVISYYENNLRPEIFVRDIQASSSNKVTALMITEKYVNQCASKLNKNSIIVRGAERRS